MRWNVTSQCSSRRLAGLLVAAAVASVLGSAHAQQRQDYMLDFQPDGSFAIVDYFGTGAMLTLEHRAPLYGNGNDLTLGTTFIAAYPLGEAVARADLRILFISIGASMAYRTVWRDLSFESGEDGAYCDRCDRGSRRDRDSLLGRTEGSDQFPYAEVRASLLLPFNEFLVGTTTFALRHEGRRDRTYDWFYTSVYDSGVLGRWEAQLFFKHRDWGGIGPYVQLLSLPRAGEHDAQWAAGFNAVTRLGLLPRNDLLFLTFLIRPGDGSYGQHNYFSPIRALVIYRMMFEL
jgi:hypothetical protein